MKRLVFVMFLATLGLNGFADEGDFSPAYERQESLELPGLTAGCHVCEWRPKLNEKPAPDQCGVDSAGDPLLGLYECGFSEDCERVCNFLGCAEG